MKTETRVGIFVIIAVGIFFYLSLNIGAIRLDQQQYYLYKTYFDNTGGLDEKSPVKIAGVEIGWVESINLLDGGKAEVNMKIKKKYKLSRNAYATIQQEGLIGTKHIDIEPGDPATGTLPPGSVLAMPGRAPTSVGDLIEQVKDIAGGVEDVVRSFRNTFGTRRGEDNLRVALDSVALATQRIANFSQVLERTLTRNESNLNSLLLDFKDTAHHLKGAIPSIKDDFHGLKLAFTEQTLPQLADAGRYTSDAAKYVRSTFKEAEEVVDKINTGKGVLGKLINEEETYNDLKKTVRGFKNMVQKSESIDILLDMHTESLFKTSNSKGYFEARLRPYSDYFYNLQLVSDENGSVKKTECFCDRYDSHGNYLNTDGLTKYEKMDQASRKEKIKRIKNDILFGFQFGKKFNRVALRVGLFESTFGFGCDYYIPLPTDKVHWISSVEAFDFNGSNRVDSTRPHLKWLNKLYFMRNVYTTFGVDDVCSKNNASPFFGAGLRFGDEDIKYLLSYMPTGGIKSSS